MEKKYKILHVDKYNVVSSSGKVKTLHGFITLVENLSIEEVIDYFMALELPVGPLHFYRVVSMNKKKRRTFNVTVSRLPGSDWLPGSEELKYFNLVEFKSVSPKQ